MLYLRCRCLFVDNSSITRLIIKILFFTSKQICLDLEKRLHAKLFISSHYAKCETIDVLNVQKIIINANKRVYYEKITNVSKR